MHLQLSKVFEFFPRFKNNSKLQKMCEKTEVAKISSPKRYFLKWKNHFHKKPINLTFTPNSIFIIKNYFTQQTSTKQCGSMSHAGSTNKKLQLCWFRCNFSPRKFLNKILSAVEIIL